ncbi:GH32 C-terminal domain-containing protein [Proteiniphilum sp.]|uniref:GH32 C-terminal domain-containing protein n=1 Tax=Proteiniphilum sp. TaxID=1926877 RepID=UPI00331B8CC8
MKTTAPVTVNKSYTIDNLTDGNMGTFEIEMDIETGNTSAFSFVLSNKKGEKTVFSFDFEKEIFSVGRSHSGIIDFHYKFADRISEAHLEKKKSYHIRLFVDKSSTECFIDNGELVQTNTVFPSEPYNSLSFESEEETTISINVYPILLEKILVFSFQFLVFSFSLLTIII